MALEVGMTYTLVWTVTEELTAKHIGSGNSAVFATPCMVQFMEVTSRLCVQDALEEGQSTVGTAVNIRHLKATPCGMQVRCEAKLLEIDRRRLVFEVSVWDERELVGTGTHERFIINTDQFMQKTLEK